MKSKMAFMEVSDKQNNMTPQPGFNFF